MAITTWADLIEAPESSKTLLAEIRPGMLVSGPWTKDGGNDDYYATLSPYEFITLADDTIDQIYRPPDRVTVDGDVLGEVGSQAACQSTPHTWYYDESGEILYVHKTDGSDPTGGTVVVEFWVYFTAAGIAYGDTTPAAETVYLTTDLPAFLMTEGGDFIVADIGGVQVSGARYYEPYVDKAGLPELTQSAPEIFWGVSQLGGGPLRLKNHNGFFDQISKRWLWIQRQLRLLIGGESLPYSQYQLFWQGVITSKNFTRTSFELDTRSVAWDLFRNLPLNHYSASVYSYLDPDAEGKPIPYLYGVFNSREAPEPVCIEVASYDPASASPPYTWKFQCSDLNVQSFHQCYIDYAAGLGWETVAHSNESLTGATFTITVDSFVLHTTKLKMALSGATDDRLTSGSLLQNPPHIVEDILVNILGYGLTEIDSAAMADSKDETEVEVAVDISKDQAAKDIIDKLCRSDIAFFDDDTQGRLRYRTWKPYLGTSYSTIDELDIIRPPEPKVEDSVDQLYWQIQVGYNYSPEDDSYLYITHTHTPSYNKYLRRDTMIVDTYITNSTDATRIAQRLSMLCREPTAHVDLTTSLRHYPRELGEKVQVTLSRAPDSAAGGWSARFFEIFGLKKSINPAAVGMTLFDLKEFGGYVGFWTAATGVTSWAGATEAQRAEWGFWSDANGYASDPTTPTAQNISVWW